MNYPMGLLFVPMGFNTQEPVHRLVDFNITNLWSLPGRIASIQVRGLCR
jgi:hypothetical protein